MRFCLSYKHHKRKYHIFKYLFYIYRAEWQNNIFHRFWKCWQCICDKFNFWKYFFKFESGPRDKVRLVKKKTFKGVSWLPLFLTHTFFCRPLYYLVIRASDRGSPSLTSETTVVITIGDVNDNSPVFQGTPYRASVSENLPVGQLILKVNFDGTFGLKSMKYKITHTT